MICRGGMLGQDLGMAFADLKNDYIFRRIFATHPDILRRLLNDLLERRDAQMIEEIEYLPGEQLPVVEGAKLSILDVRCKDRAGTTFVVEMQLIHHPGFISRVVYNACNFSVALALIHLAALS
jgi:predicted transposase/invertase (TIGR01784 family)